MNLFAFHNNPEVGIIITPMLHIRKLQRREVNYLARCYLIPLEQVSEPRRSGPDYAFDLSDFCTEEVPNMYLLNE